MSLILDFRSEKDQCRSGAGFFGVCHHRDRCAGLLLFPRIGDFVLTLSDVIQAQLSDDLKFSGSQRTAFFAVVVLYF